MRRRDRAARARAAKIELAANTRARQRRFSREDGCMRVGDDCNDRFRRERTGPPTVSRLLTQLIARHNEARHRPDANEQPETTMTGTRRSLVVDGRPPSMVVGNPAHRCSAPPATLNHKKTFASPRRAAASEWTVAPPADSFHAPLSATKNPEDGCVFATAASVVVTAASIVITTASVVVFTGDDRATAASMCALDGACTEALHVRCAAVRSNLLQPALAARPAGSARSKPQRNDRKLRRHRAVALPPARITAHVLSG